jgi:host factor-I protein
MPGTAPKPPPSVPIQDDILERAARERVPLTLYLKAGVQLWGRIVAHDRFTLVLEREGRLQLVYKSAVSTFAPQMRPADTDRPPRGGADVRPTAGPGVERRASPTGPAERSFAVERRGPRRFPYPRGE